MIASSFLACRKDAESQALSIREVMSKIKEKYQGFLAYCGYQNILERAVDVFVSIS